MVFNIYYTDVCIDAQMKNSLIKKKKKTKVTIILATSTMNTKQQDKLLQVKDVVGADLCRRNNIIN